MGRQRETHGRKPSESVTLLSALICESVLTNPQVGLLGTITTSRMEMAFLLQTDRHAENLEKLFPKKTRKPLHSSKHRVTNITEEAT